MISCRKWIALVQRREKTHHQIVGSSCIVRGTRVQDAVMDLQAMNGASVTRKGSY